MFVWIFWCVAFFSVAGVLFLVLGTIQMMQWAIKKHDNYIKTFDGKEGREKYPRRSAVIPFLI